MGVEWANAAGTTVIVDVAAPETTAASPQLVIGVQTPKGFLPLPKPVQPLRYQSLAW